MGWMQVAVYAAAINLFGFLLFAIDKWKSVHDMWRIPERQLLLIALAGGSPALLLGRRVLRHKTRKQPFANLLMGIAVVQLAIIIFIGIGLFAKN